MSTAASRNRAPAAESPLPGPVGALADRLALRANSLIITVFGDAVVPRGGNIWLGSLIALLAPFGISERLVRTGVYRLSQEGWLTARPRGRRAYYALTPSGRLKFAAADRRIYAASTPPWDGEWRLVQLLPGTPQDARQALRRELRWLGFGQLSPTLLAHPTADAETLQAALGDLGLTGDVLVFSAGMAPFVSSATAGRAAMAAWKLGELNEEYGRFLSHFNSFSDDPESLRELDPAACFALRVLLVHDYRRILLKDPQLPDQLLPEGWTGHLARDACARIYRTIAARADTWLCEIIETVDGTLPEPPDFYWQRFGGLPRDST